MKNYLPVNSMFMQILRVNHRYPQYARRNKKCLDEIYIDEINFPSYFHGKQIRIEGNVLYNDEIIAIDIYFSNIVNAALYFNVNYFMIYNVLRKRKENFYGLSVKYVDYIKGISNDSELFDFKRNFIK